jgi:hypothetical protein
MLVITIPNIKHETKDMKKISAYFYFRFDRNCQFEKEVKIVRLVDLAKSIRIQQCGFVSKYQID